MQAICLQYWLTNFSLLLQCLQITGKPEEEICNNTHYCVWCGHSGAQICSENHLENLIRCSESLKFCTWKNLALVLLWTFLLTSSCSGCGLFFHSSVPLEWVFNHMDCLSWAHYWFKLWAASLDTQRQVRSITAEAVKVANLGLVNVNLLQQFTLRFEAIYTRIQGNVNLQVLSKTVIRIVTAVLQYLEGNCTPWPPINQVMSNNMMKHTELKLLTPWHCACCCFGGCRLMWYNKIYDPRFVDLKIH